jgi:hypothetical protein
MQQNLDNLPYGYSIIGRQEESATGGIVANGTVLILRWYGLTADLINEPIILYEEADASVVRNST